MRILICCNAGMSSSIIMQKMRDAAAKRNMELTCEAVPMKSENGMCVW